MQAQYKNDKTFAWLDDLDNFAKPLVEHLEAFSVLDPRKVSKKAEEADTEMRKYYGDKLAQFLGSRDRRPTASELDALRAKFACLGNDVLPPQLPPPPRPAQAGNGMEESAENERRSVAPQQPASPSDRAARAIAGSQFPMRDFVQGEDVSGMSAVLRDGAAVMASVAPELSQLLGRAAVFVDRLGRQNVMLKQTLDEVIAIHKEQKIATPVAKASGGGSGSRNEIKHMLALGLGKLIAVGGFNTSRLEMTKVEIGADTLVLSEFLSKYAVTPTRPMEAVSANIDNLLKNMGRDFAHFIREQFVAIVTPGTEFPLPVKGSSKDDAAAKTARHAAFVAARKHFAAVASLAVAEHDAFDEIERTVHEQGFPDVVVSQNNPLETPPAALFFLFQRSIFQRATVLFYDTSDMCPPPTLPIGLLPFAVVAVQRAVLGETMTGTGFDATRTVEQMRELLAQQTYQRLIDHVRDMSGRLYEWEGPDGKRFKMAPTEESDAVPAHRDI